MNETLALLDVVLQLSVVSQALTASPVSQSDGGHYIVAAPATGTWPATRTRSVPGSFFPTAAGWAAWCEDEGVQLMHDCGSWTGRLADAGMISVNAAHDTVNRLAVGLQASLFSQEGADYRLKIDKAGDVDTASILFQASFPDRSELGLTGDNDWRVKVSADRRPSDR